MSRDKQIEEMAKELCDASQKTNQVCNSICYPRGMCAHCKVMAEHLYNAGYRKIYDDLQRQCTCYALGCQMAEQLEKKVAEEIFAKIDEIFERQIYESRWLDQNGKVLGVVDVSYAFECWRDYIKPELKKKYTEGGK